jgi:hypothetical protein
MESEASNALLVQVSGQGEGLCHLGRGAVKSGVERSDLEQIWIEIQYTSNRREIVRLVQWSQRD